MQTLLRRAWLIVLAVACPTVALGLPREMVEQVKRMTALVEIPIAADAKGFGTAFCIDAKGLFVTNAHVVAGHTRGRFNVILCPGESDQRIVHAKVTLFDKDMDLAVLQIDDPGTLAPLSLGQASSLYDTMDVTAFGYPFGGQLALNSTEYPSVSVSTGHVTSLRKKAGELEIIQLDAVLNPGNSGGPVLDGKGAVVGIVQAGLPGSGINFAIPVSRLQKFLDEGAAKHKPSTVEPVAPDSAAPMADTGRGPRHESESPPDTTLGAEKVWLLTDYLKGTAAQIRDKMNGEVERLITKVNETRGGIKSSEKDAETDTKVAADSVHKSAVYKQTLAEKVRAENDLDTARKSGTAQDRLDASSRFNKARFALEKMERDAILNYQPLLQDRRRAYELAHDQKRFEEALEKATKWRADLMDAIQNAFRVKGPVAIGSTGTLPAVRIVHIVDTHHAMVDYEAIELLGRGKVAEGLTTFDARTTHVKVIVAMETAHVHENEKMNLNHDYIISDYRDEMFIAKRHPSEVDALFDTIVPLRVTLAKKS